MDKRDPLKEVGNVSDSNEPQETGKEAKAPEITVSLDKENEFAAKEKSDPVKQGSGKLRLSFLKTFDPLYCESPEKSESSDTTISDHQKIPQLLIEESSESDHSQLSPLPFDISDDDAFVDATYIAVSDDDTRNEKQISENEHHQFEESLLRFYTPEKFNTTLSKDNIPKSTSQVADSESVLFTKGDTTTSLSNQFLEKCKVSDSVTEKRLHSPAVEQLPCKKQRLSDSPDKSSRKRLYCSTECSIECSTDNTTEEQKAVKGEEPVSDNKNKEDSGISVIETSSGVDSETDSSNSATAEIKTDLKDQSLIRKIKTTEQESNSHEKQSESPEDKSAEHTEQAEKESDEDKRVLEPLSTQTEQLPVDETVEDVSKLFKEKVNISLEAQANSKQKSTEASVESEFSADNHPKEISDNKAVESSDLSEGTATENLKEQTVEKETENLIEASKEFLVEEEKFESELSEKTELKLSEALQEPLKFSEETEECAPTEVRLPEKDITDSGRSGEKESLQTIEKEEAAHTPPDLESIAKELPEEEADKSLETHLPVDENTEAPSEIDSTVVIHQDAEQHLDSGVESIEESYTKSPKSAEKGKDDSNLPIDESLEECKVESDSLSTSDEDSKTISEGSIQDEESKLLTETTDGVEPKTSDCQENILKEVKAVKSVSTNTDFDFDSYKSKMADLSEKLSEQQQEISDLKLQLNAMQQGKASLELEIRQKEEIIIKTQAEALKNEQIYKQEIKQLREKLKENSKLIEKDGSKELEEQLKEAKAREAKAVAELNQRTKDDLNYQKIMEEYENTIATRFADYQKLKEEHETATRHLANIELAFSDLHQKYERTKGLLEGFKTNEETLSLSFQASEKTCKQHEERYESLKAHAKAQIEKSNKEIHVLKERYESDLSKYNAINKRLEIKCSSLEVSLQQKTEECAALSALCDEVTGKRV